MADTRISHRKGACHGQRYEGDSGLGGAPTPEEWAKFVLDKLSNESVVLASGARRIDTTAKQIHVPRLTDLGDADWYAELEEIGGRFDSSQPHL